MVSFRVKQMICIRAGYIWIDRLLPRRVLRSPPPQLRPLDQISWLQENPDLRLQNQRAMSRWVYTWTHWIMTSVVSREASSEPHREETL